MATGRPVARLWGPRRFVALAVPMMLLALGLGTEARAANVRYDATVRGESLVTGNTLGLAGSGGNISTNDGIGMFTDATGTLQVSGWPVGTTDSWTLASSEAVLDLPAGAPVLYAELVWGASADGTVAGNLDDAITVTGPSGAVYNVSPSGVTASPSNGSMDDNGFYGRSADVTAIVTTEGGGTWRVGAVPATLDDGDAAAGWALHVFYGDPAVPMRRLRMTTFMHAINGSNDTDATHRVDQLCIPTNASGERDLSVRISAMEADVIYDDDIRVARNLSGLLVSGARIAATGVPLDNALGSRITKADGTLDTRGTFGNRNHTTDSSVSGARQGWDVANVDGTNKLAGNWAGMWLRVTEDGDEYSLLGVSFQVSVRAPSLAPAANISYAPSVLASGAPVTVTVPVTNNGTADSGDGVFTLGTNLPGGVSYVAGSFKVDGANPPGGAVNAANALTTGVDLPVLDAGSTQLLSFQVAVSGTPTTTEIAIDPTIEFGNSTCANVTTAWTWSPTPVQIPVAVCGDGVVQSSESCDDGNTGGQDGCGATCQVEYGYTCGGTAGTDGHCTASCGDGKLALGTEACDDGDANGLDGCSATCTRERGYLCSANPQGVGTPANPDTVCTASCGDGIIALGTEDCDDGNTGGRDGCSASCAPEAGYTCGANPSGLGTPAAPDSVCAATCGDGVIALGTETCDDGNDAGSDGCSAACDIEYGYACDGAAGSTSHCTATCGDGDRAVGAEACDDGNTSGNDGCSAA
ncbi:MAG: cysteine-rich repeat protein, partial [Myxococcota bacterium]